MWNATDTALALLMLPAIIGVSGGLFFGHRKSVLKMRAAAPDAAQLQMLMETARRMEQRIHHLESILDSEAPGWRGRSRVDEHVDVHH